MGEPNIKIIGPVQEQSRVIILRYNNQNQYISRLKRVLDSYPNNVLRLLVNQGFLDCSCEEDAIEFIYFISHVHKFEMSAGHFFVLLLFWKYYHSQRNIDRKQFHVWYGFANTSRKRPIIFIIDDETRRKLLHIIESISTDYQVDADEIYLFYSCMNEYFFSPPNELSL